MLENCFLVRGKGEKMQHNCLAFKRAIQIIPYQCFEPANPDLCAARHFCIRLLRRTHVTRLVYYTNTATTSKRYSYIRYFCFAKNKR